MKKINVVLPVALVVLLCLFLLLPGCDCTPSVAPNVFFENLKTDPAQYNGQTVTFTGYWYDGFEIVVVAEYIEPQPYWPGNYQPAGIKIWVQGGLPDDVSTRLYLQLNNPTGYPAHFGKVEVTGVFEYGGNYGHMNAYKYLLHIQSARWIDWTPPTHWV
jgi:hypothetical protein